MRENLVPRGMRAAAMAAVCVALAVLGHALSSQTVLPEGGVVRALLVVFCAAALFTGRERGLTAIAGFVVAAEGVLYLWFQSTQLTNPPAGCVSMANLPPGLTVPGMCGTAVPTWAVSSLMMIVYLLGALVCALWLRREESAFFALGRALFDYGTVALLVAVALLRGVAPLALPDRRVRRRSDVAVFRLPTSADVLPVVRRGPPATAVA